MQEERNTVTGESKQEQLKKDSRDRQYKGSKNTVQISAPRPPLS